MYLYMLLGCLALTTTGHFLVSAHMIPENHLSTNRISTSNPLAAGIQSDSPPVVIVELPKAVRKNKSKKQEQNKVTVKKKKRPPPPADCVPLWGSCKSPDNVCCQFCAFCQCRLFKTVCICRMGNPRC